MNKSSILTFTLIIFGCSTNNTLESPLYNEYIQGIKRPVALVLSHNQYGVMSTDKSPLKEVWDECEKKAFSGKSVTLGNQVISDPDVITKISADYLIYKMGVKIDLGDSYEVARYSVMKSGEVENIDKLTFEWRKKRIECVKKQGWYRALAIMNRTKKVADD